MHCKSTATAVFVNRTGEDGGSAEPAPFHGVFFSPLQKCVVCVGVMGEYQPCSPQCSASAGGRTGSGSAGLLQGAIAARASGRGRGAGSPSLPAAGASSLPRSPSCALEANPLRLPSPRAFLFLSAFCLALNVCCQPRRRSVRSRPRDPLQGGLSAPEREAGESPSAERGASAHSGLDSRASTPRPLLLSAAPAPLQKSSRSS